MRRSFALAVSLLVLAAPALPHHGAGECGTSRETAGESLFVHRQRAAHAKLRSLAAAPAAANQDIGDIAVIPDSNGVVDTLNQFNLDGNTLAFVPASADAAQYRYAVSPQVYDPNTAAAGAPLAALDDDDTRLVNLPFEFPFFGGRYSRVYVNSDGNLTFGAGDDASTARSLGRMTAGPPRISPLFDDLNPALTAGGVRVLAEPSRFVVSWVAVPEYADTNNGGPQTFQVILHPDGRIEFSYAGVNPSSAVVGISPGGLEGSAMIVDFRSDPSAAYSATVAEVFGNLLTLDVVTAAQQFYQTHEDAYDYLAIYNSMDIPALGEGTVAYEETVRNSATGFGMPAIDFGSQFGSGSRLQSVLNMGPLSQYPSDPTALVPARATQRDTPLTILAHEAGHRFLAYASVPDPHNPAALPMLGFQNAHWSFLFDSEASVVEGERIQDRGGSASPEFLTTDLAQGYSPLDQYLMGFRAAPEAPDVFLVQNPAPNYPAAQHPFSGVAFDGTRRNISSAEVIQAEGRRTPDQSVAQRHFRIAFIVVTPGGTPPSAADLSKVDAFRRQFEQFYSQAASGRATIESTLQRDMSLSLSPAAGIVKGKSTRASLTVTTPPAADLTVQFVTPNGNAALPPSARIPAGTTTVTFPITGVASGVEEVQAIPADPSYETAFARVQVADAATLQLSARVAPSPAPGPVQVLGRLTDANGLIYAGAGLIAIPSADGSVVPSEAYTDSQGQASFQWNPGPNAVNTLRLSVDGAPSTTAGVSMGAAVPQISAVVNAASAMPGIAPGSLAIAMGANLSGARLLLNGRFVVALSTQDTAIEFYVTPDTPLGIATLTAVAPSGPQSSATADVTAVAPGIFPGGVRVNGDYLEIYCTGLGPSLPAAGGLLTTLYAPSVFIGDVPVAAAFSGLAPGYLGVYQVNVRIPAGIAPGLQSLILSVNNTHSNQITIAVP